MDQVRAIFGAVWRQRFWVLCVVCLLIGIASWFSASNDVAQRFQTAKSDIGTARSGVQSLTTTQVHGNPDVNSRERQEANELRASVVRLWTRLYDRQRESVLKWPDVLGDEFVQYIQTKEFGEPISAKYRDTYWNYIKNRFEELVAIVDAKKMPLSAMGGAVGGEGLSLIHI